jgi:hypothetical protein
MHPATPSSYASITHLYLASPRFTRTADRRNLEVRPVRQVLLFRLYKTWKKASGTRSEIIFLLNSI